MYLIKFFYICLFSALFSSRICAQTITVKQYIDLYKHVAMKEMLEFKIPASITLAQGLLESGSGNSRLAIHGNNHFGIKCKKDWTGCTILEDDDDLQECFRCYATGEESYKDHSRFLRNNRRYAGLFTVEITDYKGWAAGLLAAGYATNNKYTDLLIGCIERNKLAQFDTLIIKGYNPYDQQMPANIAIIGNRNIPVTIVQPDQTLESIAILNNKTEKRLAKYNDLNFHRIEPGDVIYLRPKKRKAGVESHIVTEDENMWSISQKYAIRLNSLYKKNLMEKGTEPIPGSVLHLQYKAEVMPDTGRKNRLPDSMKSELTGHSGNDKRNVIYHTHTVLIGETLYSLGKLYHISVEELKNQNQLTGIGLVVGQKLIISSVQPTDGKNAQSMSHAVITGDTLYSIAKYYNVSVQDLIKWNNLNSESLVVGQILVIQ